MLFRSCRTYARQVVEIEWQAMERARMSVEARVTAVSLTRTLDGFEPSTEATAGRIRLFESMRKQRWARPETLTAARRYNALAREHGLTPTQLALAFCYRNWRVASTIIGVTSVAQLDECLDAWSVQPSPELLAAVDQIRWETRDPAQ